MSKTLKITRRQPHGVEEVTIGPLPDRNDETQPASGAQLIVTRVSPFGPGGGGEHEVTVPVDEIVAIAVVEA